MTKQITNKGRRIFALLLVIATIFTTIPMGVFAVTDAGVTEDGYIKIRTIEDLYNIRSNLGANYILMNDIDLSEATAEGGDWDFMGNGWNPIGSNDIYGNEAFTGVFDGNGHKVSGLRINIDELPSDVGDTVYIGLFSNITGTVKNLELTGNIDYIGDKTFLIGAVSGACDGQINNCKNYISVSGTGTSTTIDGYVGGLVGQSTDNTVITNCSNYGSVSSVRVKDDSEDRVSTINSAGGIIGDSTEKTEISMCYNIGEIIACTHYNSVWKNGSYGGVGSYSYYGGYAIASGIAGAGNINDCYNVGAILAKEHGSTTNIVHLSAYAIGGVAKRCYNSGVVSTKGTDYGIASEGTYCYYLVNSCSSSNGATSLSQTQMKIESMYKGFDFENVWVLNEFANHPYPQLRSNIQDMSESAELVSIIALPTKTEYFNGDELDFTGAIVKVVYVSGREEFIDISNDIVSGFDMDVVGEQQVTVTVAGASDTYTINVKERPVVSSISIVSEPDKKVFAVGTAFDFTGAKAEISYVDGVTEYKNITVEATTGGNINHLGKQTITYTFGGQSATFEIEVVGLALEKIVITNPPQKLSYLEGHDLDLSGMVVTAVMNNGFESIVGEGYTVSGYSPEAGTHTVTVTYLGKTATFDVTVEAKKLVSLTLNTLPNKLEYVSGQKFDENGMQVIATYDNGDVIVAEDYTVEGFDDAPGIKNIVISLDGQSVSFPVKVIARVITDFKLVSLPSKLNYIEYETFDATGLIVEATYNDGITETVTDYTLTGFSSNVGTHTVAVAYEGFVKSFEINVTPRILEDIRVVVPNKITYEIGEEFDSTGMQVIACYNNGQEVTIDDYQMTGFDSSASGAKTITVTYGGIERNFAVAVQERSVIETGGTMIVGNCIGRLGDTVTVPVSVTKNTGIAGFTHTIRFDATALKFVSVKTMGGYADGAVILNDEKISDGEITVLWIGSEDIKENGVVYNLTFEVLETAKDGNAAINILFDDNDNGNISGENVIFDTINGFIEVRSYWLGDLDGDRKYAMVDLLQLAQYVSGKEMTLTDKQMLSADVNEDGIIDIHDVIMLNQWLLVADM